MQTVWEHSKAQGAGLLVLLAIADHFNDVEGFARPGVNLIAKKARCSARTVQRIFAELIRLGELRVEKNAARSGCNRYFVTIPTPRQNVTPGAKLTGWQDDGGDTAMSPGGVTQLCHQGGDTAMSPEPSGNRQIEPSEAGQGDKLTGCQDDGGAMAGFTVVDARSLDYVKADQLLDYLNAQAGVAYPKSRSNLDAAAGALQEIGQDLEGAKQTVRRQVQLLVADPTKRHWLRPVTLFDRTRFPNAYAERALPAVGSVLKNGAASKRLEEVKALLGRGGLSPEDRAALREEKQRLEGPA